MEIRKHNIASFLKIWNCQSEWACVGIRRVAPPIDSQICSVLSVGQKRPIQKNEILRNCDTEFRGKLTKGFFRNAFFFFSIDRSVSKWISIAIEREVYEK